MSSEIRASSALTSAAAQSGSAELSIQNPLFSVGGQDAFSQVLKQQVGARDDSRRPSQADQATRSARSDDSRRDKRADSRQDSGNSLPERSARASDTRAEPTPASRKATDNEDEAADASGAAAAGNQTVAQAPTESATPKQAEGEAGASEPTAQQAMPAGAETAVEPTPAEEESVLAELAALEAESAGADAGKPTDPSGGVTSETKPVTEGEAEATADASAQTPEIPGIAAGEEGTGEEEGADVDLLAAKQSSDAKAPETAQPQMSMMSASAKAAAQTTETAVSSDTATTTQSGPAQPPASSTKAAEAVASATASTAEPEQPAAEGELAHWELGHEPTAADKNAEKNAEFSRQMATASERNGPLKEQLAALAQQFKGDTESRTTKQETRKSTAVSDIKTTAFGRSLEQLSNARVDTAKPVSTGIQTPVGQREWSGELAQRMVMMVSSKLKSAEIHLNPKDLGPVEVRIRMHEDKAHVVFTSQVAQTREALEQAVPRLREMFDQNGVALGNVDVQDHGARHSHQQEQTAEGRHGRGGEGAGGIEAEEANDTAPARVIGLVDYYA